MATKVRIEDGPTIKVARSADRWQDAVTLGFKGDEARFRGFHGEEFALEVEEAEALIAALQKEVDLVG